MPVLQITKAVGIRDGKTVLPNLESDMALIRARLERISILEGGKPIWASTNDRTARITELALAIGVFQAAQIAKGKLTAKLPDGAVDPGGKTLARLAELAGPDPLTPEVVIYRPMGTQTDKDGNGGTETCVEPSSVEGVEPLRVAHAKAKSARMLVRVPGCDIEWFGVVFMQGSAYAPQTCTPLVFFHPMPGQAGYHDNVYHQFVGTRWVNLWEKYTRRLGTMMSYSGAKVILVLPLYPSGRANNFGNFRTDCADIINGVITAASDAMDIMALRDRYTFANLITASFSNGVWAHMEFVNKCIPNENSRSMSILFDSAHISPWRPSRSIAYINKKPKRIEESLAPREYHLGGRYSPHVSAATPEAEQDHSRAPFLMLHAMTRFGPR